jgi:hypothetical protein
MSRDYVSRDYEGGAGKDAVQTFLQDTQSTHKQLPELQHAQILLTCEEKYLSAETAKELTEELTEAEAEAKAIQQAMDNFDSSFFKNNPDLVDGIQPAWDKFKAYMNRNMDDWSNMADGNGGVIRISTAKIFALVYWASLDEEEESEKNDRLRTLANEIYNEYSRWSNKFSCHTGVRNALAGALIGKKGIKETVVVNEHMFIQLCFRDFIQEKLEALECKERDKLSIAWLREQEVPEKFLRILTNEGAGMKAYLQAKCAEKKVLLPNQSNKKIIDQLVDEYSDEDSLQVASLEVNKGSELHNLALFYSPEHRPTPLLNPAWEVIDKWVVANWSSGKAVRHNALVLDYRLVSRVLYVLDAHRLALARWDKSRLSGEDLRVVTAACRGWIARVQKNAEQPTALEDSDRIALANFLKTVGSFREDKSVVEIENYFVDFFTGTYTQKLRLQSWLLDEAVQDKVLVKEDELSDWFKEEKEGEGCAYLTPYQINRMLLTAILSKSSKWSSEFLDAIKQVSAFIKSSFGQDSATWIAGALKKGSYPEELQEQLDYLILYREQDYSVANEYVKTKDWAIVEYPFFAAMMVVGGYDLLCNREAICGLLEKLDPTTHPQVLKIIRKSFSEVVRMPYDLDQLLRRFDADNQAVLLDLCWSNGLFENWREERAIGLFNSYSNIFGYLDDAQSMRLLGVFKGQLSRLASGALELRGFLQVIPREGQKWVFDEVRVEYLSEEPSDGLAFLRSLWLISFPAEIFLPFLKEKGYLSGIKDPATFRDFLFRCTNFSVSVEFVQQLLFALKDGFHFTDLSQLDTVFGMGEVGRRMKTLDENAQLCVLIAILRNCPELVGNAGQLCVFMRYLNTSRHFVSSMREALASRIAGMRMNFNDLSALLAGLGAHAHARYSTEKKALVLSAMQGELPNLVAQKYQLNNLFLHLGDSQLADQAYGHLKDKVHSMITTACDIKRFCPKLTEAGKARLFEGVQHKIPGMINNFADLVGVCGEFRQKVPQIFEAVKGGFAEMELSCDPGVADLLSLLSDQQKIALVQILRDAGRLSEAFSNVYQVQAAADLLSEDELNSVLDDALGSFSELVVRDANSCVKFLDNAHRQQPRFIKQVLIKMKEKGLLQPLVKKNGLGIVQPILPDEHHCSGYPDPLGLKFRQLVFDVMQDQFPSLIVDCGTLERISNQLCESDKSRKLVLIQSVKNRLLTMVNKGVQLNFVLGCLEEPHRTPVFQQFEDRLSGLEISAYGLAGLLNLMPEQRESIVTKSKTRLKGIITDSQDLAWVLAALKDDSKLRDGVLKQIRSKLKNTIIRDLNGFGWVLKHLNEDQCLLVFNAVGKTKLSGLVTKNIDARPTDVHHHDANGFSSSDLPDNEREWLINQISSAEADSWQVEIDHMVRGADAVAYVPETSGRRIDPALDDRRGRVADRRFEKPKRFDNPSRSGVAVSYGHEQTSSGVDRFRRPVSAAPSSLLIDASPAQPKSVSDILRLFGESGDVAARDLVALGRRGLSQLVRRSGPHSLTRYRNQLLGAYIDLRARDSRELFTAGCEHLFKSSKTKKLAAARYYRNGGGGAEPRRHVSHHGLLGLIVSRVCERNEQLGLRR